jgi:hypothetical protein
MAECILKIPVCFVPYKSGIKSGIKTSEIDTTPLEKVPKLNRLK